MGSVRTRQDNGLLFLDFRYEGRRCRELTPLTNTATNRRKLAKKLEQIEFEIKTGSFDYLKHFPTSNQAARLCQQSQLRVQEDAIPATHSGIATYAAQGNNSPLFRDFVKEWFAINEIAWRQSHKTNIEGMIERHYLPYFGDKRVGHITRVDILQFRSTLAKVPGRNGNVGLSENRINKILDPLRRIFEEAADVYQFTTPYVRIKPLKIRRSDVQPFSLDEVRKILSSVRADFKNYYTVRFFTGLRTGEVDGLKWKYIDFARKLIKVRETIVAGREDYTKTDSSQRDITMSGPVLDALKDQRQQRHPTSEFVFCNQEGNPYDHNNITKRIWYPLLKKLGLEKRRPYQTRHTAATLWLAAGEAPEWIARQMGHATTEMLFKVYSRYVPNLTRQDGSAFEKLLGQLTATTTLEAAHELD